MYCRKCGAKLGQEDQFCHVCGAPTGYREPPVSHPGSADNNEEIIFNPPYGNISHFSENDLRFAEEESPGPEGGEKGFISKDEIKAQKNETDAARVREKKETGKTGFLKDNEFVWNVHEFPKDAQKTEDIEFNWNMDEYSRQEEKAAEAASFEEELFQEMEDEARRLREKNIDRFFTFSRKNEEFQKLLDREYEKFRTRSRSMMTGQFTGEAAPEKAKEPPALHKTETEPAAAEGAPAAVSETAEEAAVEEPAAEKASKEPDGEATRPEPAEEETVPETAAEATEGTPAAEAAEPAAKITEAEPAEESAPQEAEVPEEPAEEPAAEIFGEPSGEIYEEPAADSGEASEYESEVNTGEEGPAEPEPEALSRLLNFSHEKYDKRGELESRITEAFAAVEEEDEQKHRRSVWPVLLMIIAIILAIEIVILGIRYFVPDSAAADAVNTAQTKIVQTVSGWSEGIKELFSGKDSDEGTKTPDDGTSEDEPGPGEDGNEAVSKPGSEPPDPNPAADKNALISSQLSNNANIHQVKANDALAWKQGRNYGITDLNKSKPIENNVWQTPVNGEPVYFDQAIVGTVIAFDSQWIDYVNDGNKNVLDLLKKDSEAYRKAANFSRIGKIKETFKLLEIGEIRQGADGFYLWAREEIQIAENGKVTDKKYNWIYYLEPEEGKMKIVNYIKY